MASSDLELSESLQRFTLLEQDIKTVGKELGRGAYGRVYTVEYHGLTYAAKEIHTVLIEGVQTVEEERRLKESFVRECVHCSELRHPNIVRFIGISFPAAHRIFPSMIMELMDESLSAYMKMNKPVDLQNKFSILLDVAEGLSYLHIWKPPIVHRDLSPNNILLKTQDNFTVAKIADLGVARVIKVNKTTQSKLTKVPGTTDFMPPEAFEEEPVYGTSLDVFSFGGVMLFIANEDWPSPTIQVKMDPISKKLLVFTEVERRQKYFDKMVGGEKVFKPYIQSCLSNDPAERPSMGTLTEKLKSLKAHVEFDGKSITLLDSDVHDFAIYSRNTRKEEIGSMDIPSGISKKLNKWFAKFKIRGKVKLTPTVNKIPQIPIEEELWYYDIPRKDAEKLVKIDGDYLLRYSSGKGYVLTSKWDGRVFHFVLETQVCKKDGSTSYCFEGEVFPTVADLISYHVENEIPITKRSQVLIWKPICKSDAKSGPYVMTNIILDAEHIYRGTFGEVFMGTLIDSRQRVIVRKCAEKIPRVQFLCEVNILKQCDHPNIVKLLGVCDDTESIHMILEPMVGGCFLFFLRNHGANQTVYQLVKFSLDVALGMEYLSEQNCIHRDLAARCCYMDDNYETLKIFYFTLSELTDDGIFKATSRLLTPIKWTAPEALKYGLFTSASDVWSYGVLLFEIFSKGDFPYSTMSNSQVGESVEQGYRMEQPKDTPKEVYNQIMWPCWYFEPEDRPTFSEVVITLQGIISKMSKK